MARTFGFGYLRAPKDGRDFRYLMRSAMPQVGKPAPRKVAYHEGKLLDQGQWPHCVAYSGLGFMNAAPMMRAEDYQTTAIYQEAQRNDEWEGEEYDGTSVRALMKVMALRRYITSYVWGQSADEAISWMNGGYGTAIVGTNWYGSMDDVDNDGFIREPNTLATPIGGHAYRVNWWDAKKKGFLIINSWGPYWGMPKKTTLTGTAYMSRALFDRLIREDGEITAATQQRVLPVAV
jgi:hypothetical protein